MSGKVTRLVRKLSPSWTSLGTPGTAGARNVFGLDQIPEKLNGGWVYLAGMRIHVTSQYDTTAATMPGAMPGELLYTALSNIWLRSEGHAFLPGIDGLDLRRDTELRCGDYVEAMPSDVADGDASNSTSAVVVQWHANNPAAPAGQRSDGIIPVALLNRVRNPDNGFEFTVPTSFDGFAGVVIDGLTVFEAYAILEVHYGRLRIPTEWSIQTTHTSETDFRISPWGPVEYLCIAPRNNDAGTYGFDCSGFSAIQCYVGNDLLIDNRSASDVARAFVAERFGPLGAGLATNAQAMSSSAPPYLPLIHHAPGAYRTQMPTGRTRVQLTASTAYDSVGWRVTRRQVGGHSEATMARWGTALGLPVVGGKIARDTFGVRSANGRGARAAAVLDWKVEP